MDERLPQVSRSSTFCSIEYTNNFPYNDWYSKWCLSYVEHYCSQQNQKSKPQYPSNMFAVIVASIFACPPSAVPAHRLRRSKTSALLAASGVGRAQQHAQGLFRDPYTDMLFHCVALSIFLAICNIFELEGVMS